MKVRFEFSVDDIDSSNVKKMKFYIRSGDEFGMNSKGFLHVVFQSNSAYVYEDVPFMKFFDIVSASSIGQSFNNNIVRKYKYNKIS
jgi:hypothetical protein